VVVMIAERAPMVHSPRQRRRAKTYPSLALLALLVACQSSQDQATDGFAQLPGPPVPQDGYGPAPSAQDDEGPPPEAAPAPAPPSDGPPNLLLVTIDTLRVDRMSAYGNPRLTTPTIDELAEEGALFERVYAQRGSTWPSLVSILSSQHPVQHGVRRNGQQLAGDPPTLAHALGERGYRCAAVLTNAAELGWKGFDPLMAVMKEPRDVQATDRAIAWLEEPREQPFFLWVHYVAPHDPYEPPPEHRGFVDPHYEGPLDGSIASNTRLLFGTAPITDADREQLLALYDGELAWTDAQLGRLLDTLRTQGRLDHTLVAVSSDHGEELLDRQRYLFHNASIYESTLRLPLVLRLPGVVPAGQRHGALSSSLDIAPTLLELLDTPIPSSFEGRSLAPLLRGEPWEVQPVITELEDQILSVRTEDWRFVRNPLGYAPPLVPNGHIQRAGLVIDEVHNQLDIAPGELYAPSDDPLEQRDLAGAHPDAVEEMTRLLRGFTDGYGWSVGGASPMGPIDPALRARLEALGYVLPPDPERSPPTDDPPRE
jgi:arylsulfatase A-like enzyme